MHSVTGFIKSSAGNSFSGWTLDLLKFIQNLYMKLGMKPRQTMIVQVYIIIFTFCYMFCYFWVLFQAIHLLLHCQLFSLAAICTTDVILQSAAYLYCFTFDATFTINIMLYKYNLMLFWRGLLFYKVSNKEQHLTSHKCCTFSHMTWNTLYHVIFHVPLSLL